MILLLAILASQQLISVIYCASSKGPDFDEIPDQLRHFLLAALKPKTPDYEINVPRVPHNDYKLQKPRQSRTWTPKFSPSLKKTKPEVPLAIILADPKLKNIDTKRAPPIRIKPILRKDKPLHDISFEDISESLEDKKPIIIKVDRNKFLDENFDYNQRSLKGNKDSDNKRKVNYLRPGRVYNGNPLMKKEDSSIENDSVTYSDSASADDATVEYIDWKVNNNDKSKTRFSKYIKDNKQQYDPSHRNMIYDTHGNRESVTDDSEQNSHSKQQSNSESISAETEEESLDDKIKTSFLKAQHGKKEKELSGVKGHKEKLASEKNSHSKLAIQTIPEHARELKTKLKSKSKYAIADSKETKNADHESNSEDSGEIISQSVRSKVIGSKNYRKEHRNVSSLESNEIISILEPFYKNYVKKPHKHGPGHHPKDSSVQESSSESDSEENQRYIEGKSEGKLYLNVSSSESKEIISTLNSLYEDDAKKLHKHGPGHNPKDSSVQESSSESVSTEIQRYSIEEKYLNVSSLESKEIISTLNSLYENDAKKPHKHGPGHHLKESSTKESSSQSVSKENQIYSIEEKYLNASSLESKEIISTLNSLYENDAKNPHIHGPGHQLKESSTQESSSQSVSKENEDHLFEQETKRKYQKVSSLEPSEESSLETLHKNEHGPEHHSIDESVSYKHKKHNHESSEEIFQEKNIFSSSNEKLRTLKQDEENNVSKRKSQESHSKEFSKEVMDWKPIIVKMKFHKIDSDASVSNQSSGNLLPQLSNNEKLADSNVILDDNHDIPNHVKDYPVTTEDISFNITGQSGTSQKFQGLDSEETLDMLLISDENESKSVPLTHIRNPEEKPKTFIIENPYGIVNAFLEPQEQNINESHREVERKKSKNHAHKFNNIKEIASSENRAGKANTYIEDSKEDNVVAERIDSGKHSGSHEVSNVVSSENKLDMSVEKSDNENKGGKYKNFDGDSKGNKLHSAEHIFVVTTERNNYEKNSGLHENTDNFFKEHGLNIAPERGRSEKYAIKHDKNSKEHHFDVIAGRMKSKKDAGSNKAFDIRSFVVTSEIADSNKSKALVKLSKEDNLNLTADKKDAEKHNGNQKESNEHFYGHNLDVSVGKTDLESHGGIHAASDKHSGIHKAYLKDSKELEFNVISERMLFDNHGGKAKASCEDSKKHNIDVIADITKSQNHGRKHKISLKDSEENKFNETAQRTASEILVCKFEGLDEKPLDLTIEKADSSKHSKELKYSSPEHKHNHRLASHEHKDITLENTLSGEKFEPEISKKQNNKGQKRYQELKKQLAKLKVRSEEFDSSEVTVENLVRDKITEYVRNKGNPPIDDQVKKSYNLAFLFSRR